MSMKPGDFAIVVGQFGWELIEVASTTARQFKGAKLGSRYIRTIHIEDCKFFGGEAEARKLFERLTSSGALCDEEILRARERRNKRNAELIASAKSAATVAVDTKTALDNGDSR